MPTGLSSNGPFLIDGFFIEAIDQLFTGLGDEIVGDNNHRRRKSSTARTCQREKPLPAPIERIPAMLIPLSSLFSLLTVFLHVDILVALKCKCTQSSPVIPFPNPISTLQLSESPMRGRGLRSANSQFIMFDAWFHTICKIKRELFPCADHPKSGLHYACSTNANLSEGECVEKKSKSGANVKVSGTIHSLLVLCTHSLPSGLFLLLFGLLQLQNLAWGAGAHRGRR